jgi:hypothetical protein
MFVNYQINTNELVGTTIPVTGTSINIPINIEYQIVDNAELIERLIANTEAQKAVNPILDYDKFRFLPIDNNNVQLGNINYNLYFLDDSNVLRTPTYYSQIGFDDSDIKFLRSNFTESYLELEFFDTDNPMTQNLISLITIYNRLSKGDYYPAGTPAPNTAGLPLPASQIPVNLLLSNPLIVKEGFYEGYYIYTYKDDLILNGLPKYLYMRASYFNAKTGKFIPLSTDSTQAKIDTLIKKFYTRYELYRTTNGFYYKISDTHSTNVSYTQNVVNPNNKDITVKLYQAQVL